MPMIKMHLGIGFANASRENEIYVDDEEWEEMNEEEQEIYMEELLKDWAYNYIDMAACVEE